MDKQTLIKTLNQHTKDGMLVLPATALQSEPIAQQFTLFLPEEGLVVELDDKPEETSDSYILTGTGKNDLFQKMKITARFTAGDPVKLIIDAQTPQQWTLAKSFPRLQYTLAAELYFKQANLRLVSQTDNSNQTGLSFRGTMDTANSLGLFIFLLGNTDEILTGKILSIKDDIPIMRFAGDIRKGTDLNFISLGPINLELITNALPPVRVGRTFQTAVLMEVSTSLNFRVSGKPKKIKLTSGIYGSSSAIRLDADTTDLTNIGLSEVSALINSVDLSGMSFGEFHLQNSVNLSQLSLIADPLADSKLKNISLMLESGQTWTLLTSADGKPFLVLQNIGVMVAISAPFKAADLSLNLSGEIVLDNARISINAMVSGKNVQLRGYLDPYTQLTLSDIAQFLLGEKTSHTPSITLVYFDFLIQPGKNYKLSAELLNFWTLNLGKTKLLLKSIVVDWQYEVGGKTKALLKGKINFGGVDISIQSEYDTEKGWDFSGALAEGQVVSIRKVLEDFEHYFDVKLPEFLKTIELDKLTVDFNPTSKKFDFTIGGGLPVEDKRLEITLGVHIENKKNQFEFELSGALTIDEFEFDMSFLHEGATNCFVAVYTHTGKPTALPLRKFVNDYLSSSIADIVPEDLNIDIKNILFAFNSTSAAKLENDSALIVESSGQSGSKAKFVFALDVGAGIELSKLPLVGKQFPPDATVGVEDLQLLIASKELTKTEVAVFNRIIPEKATRLPENNQNKNKKADVDETLLSDATETAVIPKGLTVSAKMKFGSLENTLSLSASGSKPSDKQIVAQPVSADVSTSNDNVKWFNLQKKFGPINFERIGVKYQDAVLWFLLDAALSASGLTLSLQGLSVGSSLSKFDPKFDLHGIGIDYKGGAVEIGGAFLKTHVKEPDGTEYDEYDGMAIIKTVQFSLSAIGSYAQVNGHPSLFIYAVLDYPIGGESYFFITGLAAGFGYNRALKVPTVDKVAEFPLVARAVSPPDGEINLEKELSSLREYIPPSIGDIFFAVGIKFTSFKLIDSFAVLTLGFGNRFEINLLGISTLVVPTTAGGNAITPLAVAQLALKASFIPEEGFLGVSAQLTAASYILSKDCHLTGGFAFFCWFSGEHTGDFVLSLGGYHPALEVPAHYPKVPLLGLNWRINENISFKGGIYFALIPSALMAGGILRAVLNYGDFSAWFNAGVDFIVSWQPYHYDAKIYVDIGVSYSFELFGRHHIEVNVGADLHIWGPEFSGKAHIHFYIFSFEIAFGGAASTVPKPIDWKTFKASFLPAQDKDVCTIAVQEGLVSGSQDKNNLGVINPTHFSLVTNSVIPSNAAHIEKDIALDKIGQIGVGSMAVKSFNLSSIHKVGIGRVEKDSKGIEKNHAVENDFEFTPILKNVPVGLWGEELSPSINGKKLIQQAFSGYEITPKARPKSGATAAVDNRNLQYVDPKIISDAFKWDSMRKFTPGFSDEMQRRNEIKAGIVSEKVSDSRKRILQSLGIDEEIDLGEKIADEFFVAPLVEI